MEEAPAHEHHVIALHRHGNHLGGLPTAFWAIFSLLIILFHLFLFKLIYNEYCAGVQPEIGRSHSRFRFSYGLLVHSFIRPPTAIKFSSNS